MLALDPNQTFDVHLRDDAASPPKPGEPVFVFCYLTARQFMATEEFGSQSPEKLEEKYGADCAVYRKLFDTLRMNLVGWRNVGQDFDPDALDDLITIGEAWRLYARARRQSRISVTEKNESGSPSVSAGADSAPAAEAATTAPTP